MPEKNKIIHGSFQVPLFGKNGTLLHYDASIGNLDYTITIAWTGGNDVDICGFGRNLGRLGWNQGGNNSVTADGITATWGGDNMSGGPETITLTNTRKQDLEGFSYEVHCNWYSVGEDESGHPATAPSSPLATAPSSPLATAPGGPATITFTNNKTGASRSITVQPSANKGQRASQGDPGAIMILNADGTFKSVKPC